jgi:hypothetical protein
MTNYIYKGMNGENISGVPARDLTEEEFNGLTRQQRKACIKTGLYTASDSTGYHEQEVDEAESDSGSNDESEEVTKESTNG